MMSRLSKSGTGRPRRFNGVAARGRFMGWLAALIVAVSAAPAAMAQSGQFDGPALSRLFVPFTEIRGTLPGTELYYEDHLWRLYADGRLTGVYTGLRNTWQDSYTVEDNDTGSWSVQETAAGAGLLCIQWRHWYRGRRMCFAVTPSEGKWYRFLPQGYGPAFRGTVDTFSP